MITRPRGVRKIADIRDRCVIDAETGCWLWSAAYSAGDRSKIPVCWSPEANRVISVPRLFAFLESGDKAFITPGNSKLKAWRTCLNPRCVRHITYGTVQQWGEWVQADGRRRGNQKIIAANTKGRREASRLDIEAVRNIRSSDQTGRVLAVQHGVSETQISRIRRHKCWRETVPAASVFGWMGSQSIARQAA